MTPPADEPAPSPRVAAFIDMLQGLDGSPGQRPAGAGAPDRDHPAVRFGLVPPPTATAGRHRDVTPAADEPTRTVRDDDAPRPRTDHRHERTGHDDRPRDTAAAPTGFTVVNTNYAAPGAHVGSQHDVLGDPAGVDAQDVADRIRHAADRLQHATSQTNREGRQPSGPRTTHNVASGNDHVDQQVGIRFGDAHHHND
ncbi:hypothetical protein [Saccharothrix hoggarensis]